MTTESDKTFSPNGKVRRGGRLTESRRDEILDKSVQLFLEKTYETVSTDEIVAAIGGSKATLYRRFGGKAGLFREAIEKFCGQLNKRLKLPNASGKSYEEQLVAFGISFLETILDKKTLDLHRVVVAIGNRFPDVSHTFYEAGPHSAYALLGEWISDQQKAGHLKDGDPHLLASLYIDMLTGRHQLARLTGCHAEFELVETEVTVRAATKLFLNGLAVPGECDT